MSDLYKQAAKAKVNAGQFDQAEINTLTDEQVFTKVTGLIHAKEAMEDKNADWYVPAGAYFDATNNSSEGGDEGDDSTVPTAEEVHAHIGETVVEGVNDQYDIDKDGDIDDADEQAASELHVNDDDNDDDQEDDNYYLWFGNAANELPSAINATNGKLISNLDSIFINTQEDSQFNPNPDDTDIFWYLVLPNVNTYQIKDDKDTQILNDQLTVINDNFLGKYRLYKTNVEERALSLHAIKV